MLIFAIKPHANFSSSTLLLFHSAVHPKAGGGATAGAWTNTGSLCPATTAGRGARRSATTWRANERTGERGDDEWTETRRTENKMGERGRKTEREKRKRAYFALACSFM